MTFLSNTESRQSIHKRYLTQTTENRRCGNGCNSSLQELVCTLNIEKIILQMIPTDKKSNTLYVLPVIGIMINSLSIIHVYRNGQPARKHCYIHTILML